MGHSEYDPGFKERRAWNAWRPSKHRRHASEGGCAGNGPRRCDPQSAAVGRHENLAAVGGPDAGVDDDPIPRRQEQRSVVASHRIVHFGDDRASAVDAVEKRGWSAPSGRAFAQHRAVRPIDFDQVRRAVEGWRRGSTRHSYRRRGPNESGDGVGVSAPGVIGKVRDPRNRMRLNVRERDAVMSCGGRAPFRPFDDRRRR